MTYYDPGPGDDGPSYNHGFDDGEAKGQADNRDTDLLREVAASGVEFKMLERYYVVQIDVRTWDAIQERFKEVVP